MKVVTIPANQKVFFLQVNFRETLLKPVQNRYRDVVEIYCIVINTTSMEIVIMLYGVSHYNVLFTGTITKLRTNCIVYAQISFLFIELENNCAYN